ncbi:MAG: CAP domain-containing protein [Bacteroidales bacterium]
MRILAILLLYFIVFSLQAQDKKLSHLYYGKQYCRCIERYNKIPPERRTAEDQYIKASSFYALYKNPENDCKISNPLSNCFIALIKLKKLKSAQSIDGLSELICNVFSSGSEVYQEAIRQEKWETALSMIGKLKSIEISPTLLIDQALCEYGLSKTSALETACLAINLFVQDKDKLAEPDFFTRTNSILLKLDSTKNNDFHPFIDTLLNKFPNNDQFATSYYAHWKKEIRKLNTISDYDFMFKTMKVIFSHYPQRLAWKKEMSCIVLSIADSMTQRFLNKDENFQSYIACCNFLMKARISVGDILPNLKTAKYYSVKSTGNRFRINSYSSSIGSTINIEFSFDNYGGINNEISFNAVVPGVEMRKIKGFLWVDAPKQKRAKKVNELVNPETFNSILLDTLSHSYCNKFRSENKKIPLSWNMDIYRASKHHSLSQASLGCIFHGEDMDSLYGHPDSIDYYLDQYNPRRSSAGENCLYSYIPDNITYDSLAKRIIKQWINSPGHRANMLQVIFKSESISTTFSNYNGQLAAFLDEAMAAKYYPELSKLFEVFPDIKNIGIKPDVYYYSSQNFRGE